MRQVERFLGLGLNFSFGRIVPMPDWSTFYGLVVAEWLNRGIPLMPPAPEIEVERAFADLNHPLSADVKALYAAAGGFASESADLWSFWPLDRLREENMPERRPFVMFADWLICSHLYCFHYENPETSSVYISHDGRSLEPDPIAGSLSEFLENLLCNPGKVQAWE